MNFNSLSTVLPFLASIAAPWLPALSEKFQEHPEWIIAVGMGSLFLILLLLKLFSRLVDDLAKFILDNCKSAILLLIVEVAVAIYVFGADRVFHEIQTLFS